PILDLWLKAHAGDVLSVDRKGRPAEHIEHPALTLLLTAQPAVLAAIARHQAFRGRGLLARFLYALPESNIGRRRIGAAPVPDDVTETYEQHVRKLAEDLSGWTDPAVLTLDADAHELLLATERMIEPQLGEDGQLAPGYSRSGAPSSPAPCSASPGCCTSPPSRRRSGFPSARTP
ncbi:MAG TPA: DUF3987 domain-containing protein, partial [Pseudonocardiaceae bacterium]|nr:DUF3987 domain-containing protein [Pseudonocardiaceae bacterium]